MVWVRRSAAADLADPLASCARVTTVSFLLSAEARSTCRRSKLQVAEEPMMEPACRGASEGRAVSDVGRDGNCGSGATRVHGGGEQLARRRSEHSVGVDCLCCCLRLYQAPAAPPSRTAGLESTAGVGDMPQLRRRPPGEEAPCAHCCL